MRDKVAHFLANLALRIATPWYRQRIAGFIEYGMRANMRDANEGNPPPPDWRK